MTTIAFDGRTMAADGRATANGVIERDNYVKVFRLGDRLVGFAGDTRYLPGVKRFLLDEEKSLPTPAGESEFDVLVWDGHVLRAYTDGVDEPDDFEWPWAIGSGAMPAIAAMRAGADAEHAVRIAMTMDVFTGGQVTTLTLVE
ncbi:ATP-dependent protease HslVU (ClpYQ) peptidase subunit [Microvirgula sp. AG722]|uniref:hypothetical protein n=1 Tax=Microvirgula sp. AG722 TaxID=2183901 RepID=UPI000DC2C4AB|nr:hypothetical protein [Microvirgula sp. AG722]RAS14836.1 ATP-dependent protease HslVU (ClpYQ) peptidase subunit [Microvirgula sp. AG722]